MKSLLHLFRKSSNINSGVAINNSDDNSNYKVLKDKLLKAEEENLLLRTKLSESETVIKDLARGLSGYSVIIPVLKNLSSTAEVKTEEAVLSVTRDIFDISGKSSDLGIRISKILGETFMGDKGLTRSIGDLSAVTSTIDDLNRKFGSLSKDFNSIMDNFHSRMKDINEYLSNIVDLSEETNLLAINTAIEAARMGKNAGGFAVISKAIQKLSGRSRKIAVTIEDMIKDVNSILKKSFNDFSSSSLEFGKVFDGINLKLNSISREIEKETLLVEESIRGTENLPETIKNDLHGIIEELQFQDITRQIQQHIVEAVEDINNRNRTVLSDLGIENHIDEKELAVELIDLIKKRFTVAEEWDAVGMSIPDNTEDITLF